MADSLNSSWGALAFPVPAPVDYSLTGLDPARDILLDLLAAALTSELQDAWATAVAGTDLSVSVVGSKLPALDDLDTMRQRGSKFPLLAVARSGDPQTADEFTLWQGRITTKWTVDYVLGPLEIGNQLKLGDILTAAGKLITATLTNGGHKAYATTAQAGGAASAKQVLGTSPGCAGFSTYWVTSFIAGAASFSQGGPKYHALTATLQTTELDSIADDGVTYGGSAATIDGGATIAIDTAVLLQPG